MSPPGDFALLLLRAKASAFRARLDAMTPTERWALVEMARREPAWPSATWLAAHAADHSPDRTVVQYAAWAQSIKRRPGTQVFALVHVVHGNEGLAFIDAKERALVWFNLEEQRNFSCLYLDDPMDEFLVARGDLYWRLPDTELT